MANCTATLMGFLVDATAGGVSWTRTLGIQPDINTVPIAWTEETIPTTPGNLVLSDGTTQITLQNVKIDSHTNRRGKGGKYIDCVVRDRRWAWAYGHITGHYNAQDESGYILREKSIRELAGLCLDAMGETGYDATALPGDLYPTVEWHFANPAEELSKLCESSGCAVALLLDDSVSIVRLGTGAAWPSGALEEDAPGEQMTGRPDRYTVAGGRHVVEMTARLVPVGLDTDGRVKALQDLSYAPDPGDDYGGFGVEDEDGSGPERACASPMFDGLGWGDGSGDAQWDGSGVPPFFSPAQQAAVESVFKWYRIPESYRHLLPVLNEIVDTETDGSGQKRKKPQLYNTELSVVPDWETGRTVAEGYLDAAEWELDAAAGIVRLHTARFRQESIGARQYPAELDLTFACRWKSASGLSDGDFYSYTEGSGDLETILSHPELTAFGITDGSGGIDWENIDGSGGLDDVAAALVDQADPGAAWFTSRTGRFAGIGSFDLDGRMRSITYRVSAAGASTRAQWNMEFPRPGAPSGAEKSRRVVIAGAGRDTRRLVAEGAPERHRARHRGPGVSLPPQAADGGEWRWMLNASKYHGPRGGVCQIGGITPSGQATFGRPVGYGILSIGILAEEIPSGQSGRVYITGTHLMATPSTWGPLARRMTLHPGMTCTSGRKCFVPRLYLPTLLLRPYAGAQLGALRITRVIGEEYVIAQILPIGDEEMTFYADGSAPTPNHAEPGLLQVVYVGRGLRPRLLADGHTAFIGRA